MAEHPIYRWAHRIFAALSVVVLATGIFLIFFYRPTAAQAWNDIFQLQRSVTLSELIRIVHRWSTWIWLLALLGIGILELTRRSVRGAGVLFATLLISAGVSITGYLLPWDQLALQRVTVGTDMAGFTRAFSSDVRFVLINGVEIGVGTLRRWFFAHTILGVLVLLPAIFVYRHGKNKASST